ncbi:MAG: translational GTPase TypA [bacterium]|nr:translational GTPase TypA [bacterium]
MSKQIRNVAIIAHVDHGKTTLVDALLKQSNIFRDNQSEMAAELIMDSSDQEKERGITITSKITAIEYGETHINIIDTPGHADFGGEVERIMHMADGCLLVVDAQEGPMPQTKFVLKKAFAAGLQPIVVINKIDKPGSRIAEVEDEVADLFLELATHDSQLHYPTYYAVGREGKAWEKIPDSFEAEGDIEPVFKAIIEHIPAPKTNEGTGLQLLVTSLEWDNYEGKYAIGRVERGSVKPGQAVVLAVPDVDPIPAKVEKVYGYRGLAKYPIELAEPGDIIALSGLKDANIGETVTDVENPDPLPIIELEPSTLSMYMGPNTSPFKGRESKFSSSRQIGERLNKEKETNIGLKVNDEGIGFVLQGRGELHLSVLIETMRREGYEFEVGRPKVVYQEKDGQILEPYEEVTVEVPAEYVGTVQSEIGKRRGIQEDQNVLADGSTKLIYRMATRALLGLRSILVTETKGTAVIHSLMSGYEPKGPDLEQHRNGALIAFDTGKATAYSLQSAEARGELFISPGDEVYTGQIIGLNRRGDDLEINIVKEKHLTNMRASGSDGTIQLSPATKFSLEQNIDFLEDDELLEVTPDSMRLRKRELDQRKRKRNN